MARTATSCILLADPDANSREFLRDLLTAAGYTVDTVEDLRGALARMESAVQYDLLLSDSTSARRLIWGTLTLSRGVTR